MNRVRNNGFQLQDLEARTLLSSSTKVIGYLPEYEYSGTIKKIAWADVTQINYFSITASSSSGKLLTSNSSDFNLSHLQSLVSTAHSHSVKVDLVVGGAGLDGSFNKIAASSSLRSAFAKSVQSFAKTYKIDGVDLDWEPLNPTQSQVSNYASLIHTLRTTNESLTLSAAVNPEKLPIGSGNASAYVLTKQATQDLTNIGVMAYDLDFANHSPYERSVDDLSSWGSYLKSNGISKSKLILGVPFYGRAGTTWDDSTAETYNDIVNNYISQSGKKPSASTDSLKVKFADAFNNKSVTWYFNGPTTVANKTNYEINHGYGGVMIWELGQDHYDENGKLDSYSLLPAIHNAAASHSPLSSNVVASMKPASGGVFSVKQLVLDDGDAA